MASPKQKIRTPREKLARIAPESSVELAPMPEELLTDGDQAADQGSRIALAVWLLAFVLLCTSLLWDLMSALLFR